MAVGELVVVVNQARGVRGDATASALLTPLLRSHVHRWSATPADSSVRGRRPGPRPAEDPFSTCDDDERLRAAFTDPVDVR
ncbi:MAG TPA: hypothetical protein VHH53_13755, partial [Pseudonocardiaceae bacterium]|nr:hypothetical protein [Pseudonocardiaceae bacterium]